MCVRERERERERERVLGDTSSANDGGDCMFNSVRACRFDQVMFHGLVTCGSIYLVDISKYAPSLQPIYWIGRMLTFSVFVLLL